MMSRPLKHPVRALAFSANSGNPMPLSREATAVPQRGHEMAGSTWSNPAMTSHILNVVRIRSAVSRRGRVRPTRCSNHRNHRNRRHNGRRGIRGIHRSPGSRGNRHSHAMQPAHRCQHFPCRTNGMSPSSHRRFLLHRASPPETAISSISAECPRPVRPKLKRRPPAKKSDLRHLRPALWLSPRSSASKPASPVTL